MSSPQKARGGFGLRLWFALLGINREVEKSLQGGLHRIRKQWWGWVDNQHKSVRFAAYAVRGLLREVGAMAWDVQHGIHIGARAGWHEGAHRHAERRELNRLRNKHGEGYKDHSEYRTAVDRIRGEREARNTEYAVYSTKYRLAAHKGERLPKVSDHVPAPKPPPVVVDAAQPKPTPAPSNPAQAPTAPQNLSAPVVAFEPKKPYGGNSVTAPTQSGPGGDVRSISDMRNQYDRAITAVTSIHDQIAAAAQQARGVANSFEAAAAGLSAEGHDSQTVAEAHQSMEALQQLATQLEQLVATADSANATLATGKQGLERHRALEEAVASHPGPANRTAAYMGS